MGNTCKVSDNNSDPHNPPFRYANVEINGTFVHPTFCDFDKCKIDLRYMGGWTPSLMFSYKTQNVNCGNQEWIDGGYSNYSCDCGTLCTAGCRRKLCKRVGYNADPLECCVRQVLGTGPGRTCDPKYRNDFTTNDCDVHMKKYCIDHFFSPPCQRWLEKNRKSASSTLETVCRQPEYKGRVECACISIYDELKNRQINVPVECVHKLCMQPQSLKTYDMISNPCKFVYVDKRSANKILESADDYIECFIKELKNSLKKK